MLLRVMAKHRHPEAEPLSLVPATVEQLAAQERARPALSIKRHAIVAGATASLLLAAATSWALTRPQQAQHEGSILPGGLASAGAVEGFGLASPVGSPSVSPRPGLRPSAATLPSLALSPSAAAPSRSITTTAGGLEAAYVMLTWQGGYQVTFVVTNPTSTAVLWKIRVQLAAGARYDHSWSAELAGEGDVLTFTPPKWDNGNPRPLAPGTTHAFGFIALQPGSDYRLLSCTVDGVPCRAVQP